MTHQLQSARSSATLLGATWIFGGIESRTQRGATELHCGADPWVTLIDAFGLMGGVTPIRAPAPRSGQPLLPVRTSKIQYHKS
jgi:hypothetical protein